MTFPAPTPQVIQVRPAPRREPPFDDERPERHLSLVGRHDRPLPFATEPPPRRLARHPATSWAVLRELPEPQAFGRRLLIGVFEALRGRRTLQQLAPHLSRGVYTGLRADIERGVRSSWEAAPTIRSVHAREPADGVAELAAVIQLGPRCRAVAA